MMEEKIKKVAEVELPNDDNNDGNSTSGTQKKKYDRNIQNKSLFLSRKKDIF